MNLFLHEGLVGIQVRAESAYCEISSLGIYLENRRIEF